MFKYIFLALGVTALPPETATGLSVAANAVIKPGVACPMYRCLPPTCAKGQILVPQSDSNGCYRCPICKPCPALPCAAPLCPVAQQTTVDQANGCPGCPTCNNKCGPLQHVCPCATGSYCLFAGGMCKTPDSPCSNDPVCGPKQHSCPCATGSYCLAGNAACISPDSACPSDCPKLFCPALLCAVELQRKAVTKKNGCPGCPHCPKAPTPCTCGAACTMNGGGSGVCQVGGQCAVNIIKPNCGGTVGGDSCGKCGSSCTINNNAGLCQADGKCLAGTYDKPFCPVCQLNCPLLVCPLTEQVPSTAVCGCPTCRVCPFIACPAIVCPVEQQQSPTTCGCPVCKLHIPILQGPLATAPPLGQPETGENSVRVQAGVQVGAAVKALGR